MEESPQSIKVATTASRLIDARSLEERMQICADIMNELDRYMFEEGINHNHVRILRGTQWRTTTT